MAPLETLKEVCDRHGVAFTWREYSAYKALQDGLKDRHRGNNQTLVRPGAGKTVNVVAEKVDESGNEYESTQVFDIDDNWRVAMSTGHDADEERIVKTCVDRYKGMVGGSYVGRGLASVILQKFSATRVRQNGGAYFVPASRLDAWAQFADDMAQSTGVQIYRVACGVDENSAHAVMATAKEDLEARYKDALSRLAELEEGDDKRKPVLEELEQVKKVAANIDKGVRQH